jgi:small subunit ribosomal protein S19
MPRSVRKGPFVDTHLAKKVAEAAAKNDRRPTFRGHSGDRKTK